MGDRPKGRCDAARAGRRAAAGTGGDDNAFWTPRDFRAGAGRVRASVFVVQGLGDLNVLPSQGAAWWSALGAAHVPRKLWLSQEGHVDPFDFRRTAWVDTLHRWFDRWLQDLPDGVMATPAVSVERAPGQWVDDSSWPAAGSHPQRLALGTGDGTTGTLGGTGAATRTFTDDPALTQARAVTDPAAARPGRLVFLSGVLTADTRISGTGSVTLRVRVNRPTTELSVRLVDYGTADRVDPGTPGEGVHRLGSRSCWGDSSPADSACYPDFAADVARRDLAIVSRGWLDAAHHTSLTRTTPLATGQWYPVTVSLQPADAVVPAGHVLGLVVTGTDPGGNAPAATGATIAVDLAGSQADLPVVDPTGVPTGVAVPPAVAGHAGQHSGVIRRWRF